MCASSWSMLTGTSAWRRVNWASAGKRSSASSARCSRRPVVAGGAAGWPHNEANTSGQRHIEAKRRASPVTGSFKNGHESRMLQRVTPGALTVAMLTDYSGFLGQATARPEAGQGNIWLARRDACGFELASLGLARRVQWRKAHCGEQVQTTASRHRHSRRPDASTRGQGRRAAARVWCGAGRCRVLVWFTPGGRAEAERS